MSDYVTRLFREALGRLEGEYRGEGLDAMALAARSLAADGSRSYAAAHSVLDESARLGEMFDPFTYPALAMSATDDAIRRSVAVGGTDAADIERQLVKGGPRSAESRGPSATRTPSSAIPAPRPPATGRGRCRRRAWRNWPANRPRVTPLNPTWARAPSPTDTADPHRCARGWTGFPFGKHRGAAQAARVTSSASIYPPSVRWS